MAGFNQLSYDNQMVKWQMTHDLGFSCDYQRNPGWGNAGWIPDRIVNGKADKMCNKFYTMLFPGISSRPLVLMEELFGKNKPDMPKTPVCFEKLLVGTPMLSDDCMEARRQPRRHFGPFLTRKFSFAPPHATRAPVQLRPCNSAPPTACTGLADCGAHEAVMWPLHVCFRETTGGISTCIRSA